MWRIVEPFKEGIGVPLHRHGTFEVWYTLRPCSPCRSSSKSHALCMGDSCLDLMKLCAGFLPRCIQGLCDL